MAAPPSGEQLKSNLEDLKLTDDEVSRFTKAFEDEEFKKLFMEYAQEISDPKNRAENDAYLRQMEAEGKAEEVYGKGTQLVVPQPGFCVKCKSKEDQKKVFINVVYSEKVADATSTRRKGGEDWQVPFSIGSRRVEKDKGGVESDAFDFCIGEGTYSKCMTNERFKNMVVDTAMDAVEKNRATPVDRSYTLPKLKYKGPETPCVQAVRGEAGKDVVGGDKNTTKDGRIRPVGNPGLGKGLDSSNGSGGGKASDFSFDKAVKRKPKAPPAPEPKPNEDGEYEPKYTVVHRGTMDLQQGWGDARAHQEPQTRPQALVVRIELPGIESAGALDLDVSSTHVLCQAKGKYKLNLTLPFEVLDDKAKAKFDKSKSNLELTLPCKRPPPPAPKPFVEPTPEPRTEEGDDATESQKEDDPPTSSSAKQEEDKPEQVEAGTTGAQLAQKVETENERKWREMHGQKEQAASTNSDAAPALPPPDNHVAVPAAEGPKPVPQTPAASTPEVPAPTPVHRLRPSLMASADLDDLD